MDKDLSRIAFVTLGCPKNQVDSEVMLGHLDRAGYRTTGNVAEADVAVVNTCAFLQSAIEESIDAILEVAKHKQGRLKRLIVAGCLSDRFKAELLQELPEIDAIMGTSDVEQVVQVVRGIDLSKEGFLATQADPDHPGGNMLGRALSTGVVSPYVKISEGCSAKCTFCIIPSLRGPGTSRSVSDIVAEAEHLVTLGARELVLIAQDLTAYGIDRYGSPSLPRLLRELNRVDGVAWIRLMYANPFYWDDALVDAVASCSKVVHYVDMPIQHIADSMLKRMGRRTSGGEIRALVERLRSRIPDIALRTNVILGFPGETEEDFGELLAYLQEARFEKLVAFPYSPEPGTAAVKLGTPVPDEVRSERVDRVLRRQAAVSLSRNEEQVGKILDVLVESTRHGEVLGRSYREAPEVDGAVRVSGTQWQPGRFYPVRIIGADPYDLIGVPAETKEGIRISQ